MIDTGLTPDLRLIPKAIQQYVSIRFCIPDAYAASPLSVLDNWSLDSQREMNERVRSERDLVGLGRGILGRAMQRTLERHNCEGRRHVALLSGGLDSRGVLGGLLDNLTASEISTVTYGDDRSLDVAYGRTLSNMAGVEHVVASFGDMDWSLDGLLDTIEVNRMFPVPKVFGANHCKTTARRYFGREAYYFTGVTGDALGGARFATFAERSWRDEVATFIRRVKHAPPSGVGMSEWLPTEPWLDKSAVTYLDQIELSVFQPYLVCANSPTGYEDVAPFQDGEWAAYMLALPVQQRMDQALYEEILSTAYPRLFSVPTTTSIRRQYRKKRKRKLARFRRMWLALRGQDTHFFDAIGQMLAPGGRFHDDAILCLRSLANRDIIPWLDIGVIEKQLADGSSSVGSLVRTLVSLELNFRSTRGPVLLEGDSMRRSSELY